MPKESPKQAADWPEAELNPEIQLTGRFLDLHGDPAGWSPETQRQYETEHNKLMGGA
jgi:hypothetical protein